MRGAWHHCTLQRGEVQHLNLPRQQVAHAQDAPAIAHHADNIHLPGLPLEAHDANAELLVGDAAIAVVEHLEKLARLGYADAERVEEALRLGVHDRLAELLQGDYTVVVLVDRPEERGQLLRGPILFQPLLPHHHLGVFARRLQGLPEEEGGDDPGDREDHDQDVAAEEKGVAPMKARDKGLHVVRPTAAEGDEEECPDRLGAAAIPSVDPLPKIEW
mmetsp:Transcript_120449/g.337236  ORF Transcript_120449/g.337236 Transcript_120449/m.337236 type:complete len:217 (+) Transcript_120449:163-813(+)